jgi:hypothetical protein
MKISDFELLSQKDDSDEGHFSWRGCEICSPGIGNTVFDCLAYRSLAEAKADPKGNLYELRLCWDCIYEHAYGERQESQKEHLCSQCGKEMGSEWLLGPVCGKCCRSNHAKVTGRGRGANA